MNRINIHNLALIITNQCNLECSDCIYKDNDIDMSTDVIDTIFEQINNINNLYIYGGEPVLVLDNLEYMFKIIISNRIKLKQLNITINGTKYDSEFLRLLDYISRCLSFYSNNANVRLNILRDTEHKNSLKRLGIYRETLLYIKKYMESKYFDGFCKEPTIITKSVNFSSNYITYMNKFKMFDRKNGICNIGPLITVNPIGLVTKAGATFEEQETLYNYGNVNNESIEEIFLKKSKILKPIDWYSKMHYITR